MSKKILIIEDHPEMRLLIARSLRNLGYDLLEAADGQTGIKVALAENPDLVMLNLSLPGLSGLDVARKLKENFKTSHIPIVACSGWQDKRMLRESLEAGMVDYLAKPFTARKLAALIKRHVGSNN
jgi:CheY-like chemotaxis protein